MLNTESNDEKLILADPLAQIFKDRIEAEWAFDFIQKTANALGVNTSTDERITLRIRRNRKILRFNYCSWLIFEFYRSSSETLEVRIPLLESFARDKSEDVKYTYANKDNEPVVHSYSFSTDLLNPMSESLSDSFSETLRYIKNKFINQKVTPYLKSSNKQLVDAVFNEESRKRVFENGINEPNLESEGLENYWVFQGNPSVYRVLDAINEGNLKTWSVSAHKSKIKEGDKFILWLTGQNAGCYALGTVLSNVYNGLPHSEEQKYNTSKSSNVNEPHDRCEIQVDIVLKDNPILKEEVKNNPLLKDLKVGYQGTNFDAQPEEFEELVRLAFDRLNGDRVTTDDSQGKGREMAELEIDKNTILYGPPGTGKTYNTVVYAVAIIEEKTIQEVEDEGYQNVFKRYNEYKAEGKIAFTTFHQSYGYEEFIEGIKPQLSNDEEAESSLEYSIVPGIFKKFCQTAQQKKIVYSMTDISTNPTIWKISLQGAKSNPTKTDCFQNDRIRIGWKDEDQVISDQSKVDSSAVKRILLNFQNDMQIGDLVLSLYDKEHIDGIGVIIGDYEWLENGGDYPRARKVKWLVKNIQENIVPINGNKTLTLSTVYRLSNMSVDDVISIVKKYTPTSDVDIEENRGNYVFIIDEINRGNISKIFGELITLIETTKRVGEEEAVAVKLPYSEESFGVPNNVYLLGTMNTADRSIALMDTALRRRFKFVEMMPKADLLDEIPQIEGIDIKEVFKAINQRIEFLFDREHTIGHAYFLPLKKEPTLKRLAAIFENAILPLLQEYFYEDYSKIQLVLADNVKDPEFKFILNEKLAVQKVFKGNVDVDLPEEKYSIQRSAFFKAQSYLHIY